MARLYYMSLAGVGPWDRAMKDVGAQLRPYGDYLQTALDAAGRRKLVLRWRSPSPAELEVLDQRRIDRRARGGSSARKRRDRHAPAARDGVWVVLEPPPWDQEAADDTFDEFLDARDVHDHPGCRREAQIKRLDFDREARALLLDRLPEAHEVTEPEGDGAGPPSAASPRGPLLWLRPDTHQLERQLHGVQDLENEPTPRLAPLLRLAVVRAQWTDFTSPTLPESDWVFLKRAADGRLRDGTDEQRRFVEMALVTPDFAILDGPPGSGKSTAICELIVQFARRGKRVLLVASTHVAVDGVLERIIGWQDRDDVSEKLVVPVRVGDENRITSDAVVPFTLARLNQTWRDELLDFVESPPRDRVRPQGDGGRQVLLDALQHPPAGDASPITRLLLDSANLVCGTTIGIIQHPLIKASRVGSRAGEPFEPFDVMILDEASKTTFTEFLVPARHARRWVVSGDVRQLSPYVDESNLAENLNGLVREPNARAAVHAFLAKHPGGGRPRASIVAAKDDAEAALVRTEAEAREVEYVDLDRCEERTLRGVPGAVPELLFADLVVGTPAALRRFEHRLPEVSLPVGGPAPELPDHDAAVRARVDDDREEGPPDWGSELAWRMTRSYELRMSREERHRYDKACEDLLPVSLGDDWYAWRKLRPRGAHATPETPRDAVRREVATVRRVGMPSILEILQRGTERLPGWEEGVTLTDGLPKRALAQRLVALSFQHRMHPHNSAFPREQFYAADTSLHGDDAKSTVLLQDASTMEEDRAWSYSRYARRALWIDIDPGRSRGARGNVNPAEATRMLTEVRAFVEWARTHSCYAETGDRRPWQIAALTFYKGQEAFLRDALRRQFHLPGNSRNFTLLSGQDGVTATLGTVDRFQGHEADLVLLSFVKSRTVGFLNSPNRLTVALTRGRFQLVLLGHRAWFQRCGSHLLKALALSQHYKGDISWETAS